VIDWMWPIIGGVMATVVVSFWGWLAVQVISQGRKLVELEARLTAQDHTCQERLQWIRRMDRKLDQVADDTSVIRGVLGKHLTEIVEKG